MESGAISNAQITGSSQHNDDLGAINGRLKTPKAWSSKNKNVHQWLQIDLGNQYPTVSRVATQGSGTWNEWVTEYKLDYGNNGVDFQYYIEQGDTTDKV